MGIEPMARQANATDVRVDSTGGLDMVLTDETEEISPYVLGNPAGLALLPKQSSFEVSAPWYSTTNTSGNVNWTYLGISPGLVSAFSAGFSSLPVFTSPFIPNSSSNAGYQYQGLLNVPSNGLAFQMTGGFNESSNNFEIHTGTNNGQGGNELARAAYNFGPLAVGTELQFGEASGLDTNGTPVTNTESVGVLNTGLLVNIPLGKDAQSGHLHFGGAYSINILPSQEQENFINTKASQTVFEPCLFLDIPGTFQAGALLHIYQYSGTQSHPDIPPYQWAVLNSLDGAVLYKCKMTLGPTQDDPSPLSFNHGMVFSWISDQETINNSNGTFNSNLTVTYTQLQFGLGLERERDFTLGLQANWMTNDAFSQAPSSSTNQLNNSFLAHYTLGGEKWVSPNWALRMGLTWLDDHDSKGEVGPAWMGEDFFDFYSGQDITGIQITSGVGYQDKSLRVDGMAWFEQPQSSGAKFTGPNYAYTVFGAQLSLTFYL